MIFNQTKIKGAYTIQSKKFKDERGSFNTLWANEFFEKRELNSKLFECNISFNKKKGTLRGMHYQISPFEGSKLVRCIKGKTFDVILDLRKNSETFQQWIGTELSAENGIMNYIPEGCAHGFQTLDDNVEVLYLMSQIYNPESARVAHWDDEDFGILWPLKPTIISEKDSS